MRVSLGRLGSLALVAAPLAVLAMLPSDFTAPAVVVAGGGGPTGSSGASASVTVGQSAASRTGSATFTARVGFQVVARSLAEPPVGVDDTPAFRDQLLNCAPNPFNPATTIRFSLGEEAEVRLDLYDVRGRRVARLLDELRGPGHHAVDFRPTQLSSGVYLLEMTAGSFRDIRRMVLLK